MPSRLLPRPIPSSNSVTFPSRVIRPIAPRDSVNHRLPSGPATIPVGWRFGWMPSENSVISPSGVIRPTRPPPGSVNHRLSSGPSAMSIARLPDERPSRNSVISPSGVMRPIAPTAVNHTLPSGPAVIPTGWASALRPSVNSVMSPIMGWQPTPKGPVTLRVGAMIGRMDGASDTFSYGADGPTERELRLLGDVKGKRVLELGCGTGAVAIALARQGAVVIGIDSNRERLAEARARGDEAEVRVDWHHGDLADLAFLRADSIDAVVSVHALSEVDDAARLFRQVERVLRPGAPFVFSAEHPTALCMGPGDVVAHSVFDR